VLASFVAAPLPSSGTPGEASDVQTIAVLARAMLTRSVADPERDSKPLAELRPGLPSALIEEMDRLVTMEPGTERVDARGFIARVAMADALKDAETHRSETKAEMTRQQEEHRAQIEKERREHDAQIAAERKAHEEQIATERRAHEESIESERKKHESTLLAERKKHDATLHAERKKHEREMRAAEREIRAAQKRLASAGVPTTPMLAQTVEERIPETAEEPIPPTSEEPVPDSVGASVPWTPPRATQPRFRLPDWRREWNVPAAAIVAVLLLALVAFGVSRSRGSHPAIASSSAMHTDSAAGSVVSPTTNPNGLPTDLANGVAARAATDTIIPDVDTVPVPRRSYFGPARETREPARDSAVRDSTRSESVSPSIAEPLRISAPTDSLPRVDLLKARRDSLRRRDSLAIRDSIARRDSTVRRDTLPRDTTGVTRR
jgi:hypothetical protein